MTTSRRIALCVALPAAAVLALPATAAAALPSSAAVVAERTPISPEETDEQPMLADPRGSTGYAQDSAKPADTDQNGGPAVEPTADDSRGHDGYGVSPGEVPIPSETVPAATPAVPGGGVSPGEAPIGGQLPVTGVPVYVLAIAGVLLAGLGFVVRYGARRSRA